MPETLLNLCRLPSGTPIGSSPTASRARVGRADLTASASETGRGNGNETDETTRSDVGRKEENDIGNQRRAMTKQKSSARPPMHVIENREHRWLESRVRGVRENGKEYYYGEISRVCTVDGKKRFFVSWDGDEFDKEDYDFNTIRSLMWKGSEEVNRVDDVENGFVYAEVTPEVAEALVETATEQYGFVHVEIATRGFECAEGLHYERDESGELVLTDSGRAAKGVGLVMEVQVGSKRSDEEAMEEERQKARTSVPVNGNWEDRAIEILRSSLRPRTQKTYRCAMNRFNEYLMFYSLDEIAVSKMLSWDPATDDVITKSARAEMLFCGFVTYCVECRGTTAGTASQYKTNVKSVLHTESGVDVSYGQDWKLMRKLVSRLETLYPNKRVLRRPILQQHLRKTRKLLDLYVLGYTSPSGLRVEAKERHGIVLKEEEIGDLLDTLVRDGVELFWVTMVTYFMTVSRGADISPDQRHNFDPETDATLSDLSRTEFGMDLNIKLTKTGRNKEFSAKPLVEVIGNVLCPVRAMEDHIAECARNNKDFARNKTTTPLFRRHDGEVFTTRDLYDNVKAMTKAIGLDPRYYGAHSLRIGGATAALACAGGSEVVVKVLGYWVSEAVRIYTKPTRDMVCALGRSMVEALSTEMLE